jgi:aminoglycoside phosphotransferase (APT) family kinase protein
MSSGAPAAIADASMEEQIRAYLAGQFGAADLELRDIQRISVGWSHETWLFDASWRADGGVRTERLCLRRDPGNALLREMSDLGTQFAVLCCLESTSVPTPRPYFYESNPAALGAPFLVMERVRGVCPSPWGSEGRRFYADAAARGVLPASFTDTLVALHTLDWRAAGLEILGVPGPGDDFAQGEIAKWRGLVDSTGVDPDPVLIDLICWLERNAPVTERLALVHGAYRTGNLLIDEDRVSAVLDWETEVIGDPMYDVAYVLSPLNREGTELLSNLVDRDEFYRRYEAGTGIEIDDEVCRYYQLLYAMRSVVFWMSASGLFASGGNVDLRLARTAWSIPVVLDQAARALGY